MANPYYKSTEEYLEEWGNRNTSSGKSVEEYRTNYQNALSAAVQKGEEKRQQSQVQTPVLDASKAAAAERAKRREEKRQAAGVALPSSATNAPVTPETDTSGLRAMSTGTVKQVGGGNAYWNNLSDDERARIIAEYNDEQIVQQAEIVNKQYDEKMTAYNQANAAYDEWLKKNQSDEVINAMAADYDAPEWVAFRAEGEKLYAEAKKYDDEADALRLEADALHDQALYIQDMRRLNELLPKMDEETRKALDAYAEGNYGYGLNTNSKQYYDLMAKLGVSEGEARRLAETWKRNKNKEGMEAFEEGVAKYTKAIPGVTHAAANLQSISANVVAPFTGFLAASFAGLSGGRYRSADPNGYLFAPTAFADTVRQTTASDIAGENGNLIRQGVADIYNGAMGAADNVLRTVMYGEKGTVVMAMDVFQRTVRNASASGATKEQALALGLASAGLEYATEQVAVENMLDILNGAAKEATKDAAEKAARNGFINFLKQSGKNYVEELPQELISFWGNAAAEAVILRQNSDFNKSVRNYMTEQGMTQEEAEAAAWKDLLWDGTLRVAWDTGWSTLFQTGFATGVKKVMENMAKDSAEGAPPTTTPPTTPPVTQQKTTEAVQGEKTAQEAQTPTAEQKAQQLLQGLPGQQETQAVQQQAQEGAETPALPQLPQTQEQAQTQEQEQAAPQQMSPADEAALKLAQLTETKDYPGMETKTETVADTQEQQEMPTEAPIPSEKAVVSLSQNRDGDNGWGKNYPTAQEALNDAVRTISPDLYDAFEKETDNTVENGHPIINAFIAVQEDVRQDSITPMQGARLLANAYENAGVDGLVRLYNQANGNLYGESLDKAKAYGKDGADGRGTNAGGFGKNTVGGAQSQFDHEVKTSEQYSNTYAKTGDAELQQLAETAKEKDPTIDQYTAVTEAESLKNAEMRTRDAEERAAEYDYLMEKDGWTAEDNDTAYAIEKQLMRDGDADKATKLERRRREEVTNAAQVVQSQAKYSRNADEAYSNGAMALGELTKDNVPKRFWKKQGFDTWKAELTKSFSEMVEKISAIPEGDTEAMKDVIRSLARFRNTTAWFGLSKGLTKAAEAGLRNLDYDMAKTVALTQVSNIPGDFAKRSVGEVTKTIVFQNLLASLISPIRNIEGNTTSVVIEAVTDSTVGQFFDYLVSKATGVREVGNDIAYGKEFIEGGKKAAEFGSLCVELAIPMESDDKYMERSDKDTGMSHARTFSPKGGIVSRYLSAVEKYYSYAYGVSDLFYEGGSASAVDASLQKLGDNSGLTDEARKKVSGDVGKRRTFKQDGHLAKFAKGMKKAANTLTDKFSPDLGLGDLTLPFSRIGANLGTMGADYSGLGVFKGFGEVLTLISDAKKGKKIEPGRQRKAVTDAARGVTGFGIVAMLTGMALKGIIRGADDDDWDRAAYEESTGQVGAQFNISAAIRDLIGKSTEWQKDDVVLSLDFLEPFNAQMLLAAAMAKDIQNNGGSVTIGDYVKNSLESVTESILNNPGMELLGDLSDLVNDLRDAENPADYADIAGETLGGIASGFVPLSAAMRQLAKTIDPVKRDTTGRNVWETALNRVMTGIPFASQTLPAKYGAGGEPIARNEPGWLTAVNNFLNPGTATQLKDPAIADYLGALSDRTGNVSIYPESKAPKSFAVDGKKIEVYGKEDRETYHRTYMENIETVYGGLINDGEFTELSDGRQLAVLGYAKEYATAMAKKALYKDYKMPEWMEGMEDDPVNTVLLHEYKSNQSDQGNSFSENKHGEMVGAGIPDAKAKDVQTAVAGLKPEAGQTNVRTIQQLEAIMDVGGLSENQRAAAMHAYLKDDQDAKMDKLMGEGYGLTVDQFVDTYRAYLDRENAEDGKKDIAAALGVRASDPLVEKVWKAYQGK